MVDGAVLEKRCTAMYREFESLLLRSYYVFEFKDSLRPYMQRLMKGTAAVYALIDLLSNSTYCGALPKSITRVSKKVSWTISQIQLKLS